MIATTTSQATRPPRLWRVWVALAAAWALAVVPAAAKVHQAAVQHVRCAEHGEMLEVAGVPDGPGTAAGAHREDHKPALAGEPATPGHDHECAFLAFLRGGTDAPADGAEPAMPRPNARLHPAAADPAPADSTAPWRYAPKQSPPRA